MLTEEQRKVRAGRITSTDIARIVGLDPYAGPLRVYLEKVGEAEQESPSSYGEAGLALEEPVARAAATRDGMTLLNPGTVLGEDPVVAATPDRIRIDGASVAGQCPVAFAGLGEAARADWREVVEIKTVWTSSAREQYGEADTDHVPLRHVCQVTWEMVATGLRAARLYAFFPEPGVPFADAIRRYVVPFDADFAAELVEQARRFWRDHVERRMPPPLDATKDAEAFLQRRYPRSRGTVLPASLRTDLIVSALWDFKNDEARREEEIATLENRLKAAIGDADGIESASGLVTWRSAKAKDRLDVEALTREPGVAVLIAKHTKVGKLGEGPRVFRGPWSNRRK